MKLTDEQLADYVSAASSLTEASRITGLSRRQIRRRLEAYRMRHEAAAKDKQLTDEEWLHHRRRVFEAHNETAESESLRRFTVPCDGPYGLLLVGDPHVDDDRCNWPLLEEHGRINAQHKRYMFAVNVGDSTNNWSGRLAKLWADQSTSAADARRAVRILMNKLGFNWFLWLHGNHDSWSGPVPDFWVNTIAPSHIVTQNWSAACLLLSKNHDTPFRAIFAHDFKGHSLWNPMHGPLRAASLGATADLFAAGHRHLWGVSVVELPERHQVTTLVRVRGYKHGGLYEREHGFLDYRHGASVLVVVDPSAPPPGRVSTFADVAQGADFLAFLRKVKG